MPTYIGVLKTIVEARAATGAMIETDGIFTGEAPVLPALENEHNQAEVDGAAAAKLRAGKTATSGTAK